jgi:xylan 1,4-beta-xylosidase
MATIHNPILRGFNPDPSIVRVGTDYYIATSTFEWFPGVQIHHSRDLAHWRLVGRPLDRASQLNLLGDPDSCGIWAPCLTHDGGRFYLIYTDVKRYGRAFGGPTNEGLLRDTPNYLVTADRIEGPWSDPIDLNSSGFDPSLFHDEDDRKYLLNMLWDHRPGRNRFAGIVCQEFSAQERRLIGRRQLIFRGTELGLTEGPHVYRRGGYYYLLTAEGGTAYGHAVTMARSPSIWGPYELDPAGTVLTSRHHPEIPLQRAGHGDVVETPKGETFLVHLCGRPLTQRGRCTLGRETAIQRMRWTEEGWLRTSHGDQLPRVDIEGPDLPPHPFEPVPVRADFDHPVLPVDFQWLRTPWPEELFSLSERPGHLRLYGREAIGSWFRQALVARRLQSHACTVGTRVSFEPENFQQSAGLVCYYNRSKFHFLHISYDEKIGKYLGIMSCYPETTPEGLPALMIALPSGSPVELRAQIEGASLRFSYQIGDGSWQDIDPVFDASILSDEAALPGTPNFTGAFVGMACHDVAGTRIPADFDYFDYEEVISPL